MSGALSVLVVDDVAPVLDALEPSLRRLAARLPFAWRAEADARAALALARTEPFDLVLSDLRMPHVDGLDLLLAARQRNPSGRRALMTGYTEMPANDARLRAASPDAVLLKPLRGPDLVRTLGDLLSADPSALAAHREDARRALATV